MRHLPSLTEKGINAPADMREFVDTTFGPTFSYFRESNSGSI